MTQNPQLNESDTLEKLQRDWFSQLEYLESSTLEEAKERIQELVESMEEPIQHHFKEFLRHDNLLRE